MFCGTIEQGSVQRIFAGLTLATQKIKHLHLLFQSTGGFIGEGICLYNFFRAMPIELTLYNVGTVSSIAAVAFLGARNRKASRYATFMLHRSHVSPQAATAEGLEASARSLRTDDERTDAILREHLKVPPDKWPNPAKPELWLTAKEAVECGLATGIGEFGPPVGSQLYCL